MSLNFKNLYTSNNPPLQATLMRGSNVESIHKIHAVITDKKGRVLIVQNCQNNWCEVKTDNFKGWIENSNLWGEVK